MAPVSEKGRGIGRVPYPNPFWSRIGSLLLAIGLSGLILVYPRVVAETASEVRHGALTLLLWGVAAGFVHGVGFVPRMKVWRVMFHPVIGWLLMFGGSLWIVSSR